ncbi:MAG: sugar transferase [Patescibacteria group bacterium]
MQENYKKFPIPKIKRLFDIVFSLLLLVIFSPLFIVLLALIFIEHLIRGQIFSPLFYVEKRISQGEPINFIKFNVFKPEIIKEMKESELLIHTKRLEKNGNYLLKTGKIIQRVYLDELPQLFNIFKGDLSMVGPRPTNPEVYQRAIGQGMVAKAVMKAGLTGIYQSRKGMTDEGQLELDREYLEFSINNPAWKILLFDMKIILATFRVLFRAKGI